ncbi:MAG: hypothetical protein U5N85_17015 [Arcicella sp.]|nr:hypothetical protein [Arcicella sp.]
MELDELKNIWQQAQQETIYHQGVGNEGFTLIIKQKSKAISDKLRRNLDIDMIISILFLPPLFYVILWSDFAIYHKFVAVFFLIYTVISLVYYFKVVKLYREVELKNDLLTTLAFTVKQFEKQVKGLTLYNHITIIPLMFYGSIVGAEVAEYYEHPIDLTLKELLFCVVFATPIAYFYMRYFIKSLYGNHLVTLKQHLAELENEE